jgi:hypothetical protein
MKMKKRTCEIKIRLTDEELAELNAKVGQTVFSSEEFCRRAITGKEVKQAPSPDIPILIRDLRRAGSNANQLLKIAEFAGMKFTEEETQTSTMTPDTELMLSTLFAQGRKVEPKQPESVASAEAANGAEGAANAEGESETHAAEPSITVFSGLG